MRNSLTVAMILTIVIIAGYDFFYKDKSNSQNSDAGEVTKTGSSGNALIGGEFTLVDQNGEEFSSEKLKGKTSLIYFGFTNCPMICPTALNNISLVMNQLDDKAENYRPMFITTDPERDTSEVIKEYISSFHPSFVGLTGSKEQLEKAYDAYKVYASKVDIEGSDNYDMNHSSIIYVMNEQGEYTSHFSHQSAPEEILEKLNQINK